MVKEISDVLQTINDQIATLARAMTTEKKHMKAVANQSGFASIAGRPRTDTWRSD